MTEKVVYNDSTPNNFPDDYDDSKVDSRVKIRSKSIAHKEYGNHVREALMQGIEIGSVVANEAKNIANESKNIAGDLNQRWDNQINGKIEPDEVVDARVDVDGNTYDNLKGRLDNMQRYINDSRFTDLFSRGTFRIAHQGMSQLAPGNSAISYELAGIHGFNAIETDVKATSDGELVCYHDADLSTLTNGSGAVSEVTAEYINGIKYNNNTNQGSNYPDTPICKFDEYIKIGKKYGMYLFVEIQTGYDDIAKIVDLINAYGMQNRVVYLVSKFNYNKVDGIRCFIPEWGPTTTENIDFCSINNIELCGFASASNWITEDILNYANTKGIIPNAYIVNDWGTLSNLQGLGIRFIESNILTRGDK